MSDWRPTASRRVLETRAELTRRIRAFFTEHAALEVETPVLSRAAPTDPFIHGLRTEVARQGTLWLQTSPEFPMKRLLAAGLGDCWQLCRVFRDGERGRLHNPEFTMLEWYRTGFDDRDLMMEVDALVRACLSGYRELGPTRHLTFADAMARADADARDSLGTDDEDAVLGALVAPALGHDGPCFVTDWPVERAALARLRGADPPTAARFELFIDGVEIANGFHELADAEEQRRRFDADNAARLAAGHPEMPLDERLLAALDAGLPDCAGVALGFDRLAMLACGTTDIAEVLAFPVETA